eukprot:scaffold59074_cov39-Prasinocladus_malaysianus.AAC.1
MDAKEAGEQLTPAKQDLLPPSGLPPRMGPLRRAVPSAWQQHSDMHGDHPDPIQLGPGLTVLAWASVSIFCALFYLGPASLVLAVGLFLTGHTSAASVVGGLVALSLAWPSQEWPAVRRVGQLWYPLFDLRHNL